jgi:phosphatidylethanolamine-binding protein (PEBP) family uncharacterized protein
MMFRGIACAALLALGTQGAAAFSFTFDWAGLKLCTSGSPNTVVNPRFVLSDVPPGTAFIRFRLVDRNVPDYDHGGGLVAWTGSGVIAPGAFRYKSPCPPNGRHTYEWTATAQSRKNGGKLGVAKAALPYP